METENKYLTKAAAKMYNEILTWCKGDPLSTVNFLYNEYLKERDYKTAEILNEIGRYLKEEEEENDGYMYEQEDNYNHSDADNGL